LSTLTPTPVIDRAELPPDRAMGGLREWLGVPLGVLGVVCWILAVHNAHYSHMGSEGLITILGWPYFAGLIFVVCGFVCELIRKRPSSIRLFLLVAVFVVYIYGTAPAVEPVAALTDSWIHAGFIQYILVHGHPLEGYDARFSWPGAFSMGAVLVKFAGQANAIAFLRWFPMVIEFIYLAPLLAIARYSGVGRRAGWLGIIFYFSANWIFQDYFSPQALNYLFYLVVVAAAFACWRPVKMALSNTVSTKLRDRVKQIRNVLSRDRLLGRHVETMWTGPQTFGLCLLVALIFLAASMSHQLTPYALIIAMLSLLITRRLGRPELVVVIIVLTAGWLSLGASNYWVGHLGDIFGSIGQFGNKLHDNVTGRVVGSQSHVAIVELRILLTGGFLFLAGIGFFRRAADSRVLEVLMGAPFLLLGVQDYGGEGLLRVVLFGLPFTSLLAASAFLPNERGEIRSLVPPLPMGRYVRPFRIALPIIIAMAILISAFATTIVRGGNDAYTSFSSGELAAVNYMYGHIQPGQIYGVSNYFLPVGQSLLGVVTEYSATEFSDPKNFRELGGRFLRAKPEYIIFSQSQENYGEDVDGYPPGWQRSLEHTLLKGGYNLVARWATASVLKLSATRGTVGSLT
jgi:hypothetical protein